MEITEQQKAELAKAFALRGARVKADIEGQLRRPRLRGDGVVTVDIKADDGKLQIVEFSRVTSSERATGGAAGKASKADAGVTPHEAPGKG